MTAQLHRALFLFMWFPCAGFASSHALYLALGHTAPTRREAYRRLFDVALAEDVIGELRAATNGGWAIGGERFKQQIAKALGRRVTPRAPGRPADDGNDERQINLL